MKQKFDVYHSARPLFVLGQPVFIKVSNGKYIPIDKIIGSLLKSAF